MSGSYVRPPHYQRHYQSMVLNLCSIYPYFETDNFDRAYNAELASAISKYPTTGLDFQYYWTERVMWEKFGLSGAYGEFPGRYGGLEYVAQQQIGVNQLPPTPPSAQSPPGLAPKFFEENFSIKRIPDAQTAQPVLGRAPELSKHPETPTPQFAEQRDDLITMLSDPTPGQSSQRLARNIFEGYLNPQDPLTSIPALGFQRLATKLPKLESSFTPQATEQSTALAAEFDPESPTPSSLLAARIAFHEASDPSSAYIAQPASRISLPPLLLPNSLFKDPTTGELITVKMFERRCLSRGANTAIQHAQETLHREKGQLARYKIFDMLERSLNATLVSIIEEHNQQ